MIFLTLKICIKINKNFFRLSVQYFYVQKFPLTAPKLSLRWSNFFINSILKWIFISSTSVNIILIISFPVIIQMLSCNIQLWSMYIIQYIFVMNIRKRLDECVLFSYNEWINRNILYCNTMSHSILNCNPTLRTSLKYNKIYLCN